MNLGQWLAGLLVPFMFAANPSSTNFELNSYGFGTGGTQDSSSTNYRANGTLGEVAGDSSSTNYNVGTGETRTKEANVPLVTITNDGGWYNKLRVVIGPENNPSDAKFAIAISTDNFATTQYVKSDFTVGATLTQADYLTYAGWGSTTGVIVRGLTNGAVYTVKARGYRGAFTESRYGPPTSAATADPQLIFDIDVSATDTSTTPPYQIDFGNLLPGSVQNASKRVWVSLDTNAESGAKIYLSGQNGGLRSSTTAHTITSATGDLGLLLEGFGAQGASATQVADGPLALSSPYDGTGQNTGITDAVIRDIFSTPSPVTGGRGSLILKAKTRTQTPAAADYTEILTALATGSF